MRFPTIAAGVASVMVLTGCLSTPGKPDPVETASVSGQVRAPRAAQLAHNSELDRYIEQGMREWGVPGVAVAVAYRDSVVLARGYGNRHVGKSERVTEDTLFAIGSCTKAFTASALAMLVEERKLDWDRPVIEYMPTFRLADPYITRNATLRDLLLNRSGAAGIEGGELKTLFSPVSSRREMLERLAKLPTSSFRSRFDYSNGMYLAAGQIIESVTGRSYDEFVRERIFEPLGMTRSTTSIRALEATTDVATPHVKRSGEVSSVPWRNIDMIAPAGSINSSAADMAQWLRLQLSSGRIGDRRLIDAALISEMQSPGVVVPRTELWALTFPGVDLLTWGMGWTISEYGGVRLVEHTGIIDGHHALVGLIPSHGLGIVILSNLDFSGNRLPEALRYRVYDTYLGRPQRDWSAELLRAQR